MEKLKWREVSVLVTGGTGSFGQKFVEIVLNEYHPQRLIVFSRDELKQHEMRKRFPDGPGSPMRYFLGDIRDPGRLDRAFHGVDLVVHAAALKQVPACEYNPFEAIQTNVIGARNIIDAAIDHRVQRAFMISTDKAVSPVNLYGASKLCAEKLFVQGNSYAGERGTQFSCSRYGNVIGSRGSVVEIFLEQRQHGYVTLTDPRMTRFWVTLEQGVRFVLRCLDQMHGGEIFVPKVPSMKLRDLADAIAPGCEQREIGIRPGEKLHELLVSEDEAAHAVEFEDMFVIRPAFPWWKPSNWDGPGMARGFRYSSDSNTQWLTPERMRRLADDLAVEATVAGGR